MSKNEGNIDIEFIRRKIKNDLNKAEEARLRDWLRADESHQIYYDKAFHYFVHGDLMKPQVMKQEESWQKIRPRLERKPIRRFRPWMNWAASVAALFILVLAVYTLTVFKDKQSGTGEIVIAEGPIVPGKHAAELILSDGRVIRLGQGENALKEQDGTVINTDSSAVSYQVPEGQIADNLYNEVRVKRGEEFRLTLEDGTRVWINSMSSIKFPVHFNQQTREVEIKGEVYFEVAHNNRKPFVVQTPLHNIRVLGTRFNVSCYENDELATTTLVEGSIEINNIVGEQPGLILEPNTQYAINKSSLQSSVREVRAENYIAWTKGFFQFDQDDLYNMFKELERWYNIEVFYNEPDLKQEIFTGRLPRFESVNTLLSMIEQVSDVEFEINQSTIIVK